MSALPYQDPALPIDARIADLIARINAAGGKIAGWKN